MLSQTALPALFTGALLLQAGCETASDTGEVERCQDGQVVPPTGCPCTVNQVPLELTIEDGVADSQVVPVTWQGEAGYLAIDTGSPLTFVFGEPGDPEFEADVGEITIGCELLPVARWTIEALGVEDFNGLPIFGILGLDFFQDVPSEMDYPGRQVVRYLEGSPDVEGLAPVPAEFPGDRLILSATVDGLSQRLIYDAGAHHTIQVGVEGNPGDEEIALGTADGEATTVWEGTAILALGEDTPREITIWRAPTFPYLDGELEELGAGGLLGATGLGFRRVVFEAAADRLWLGEIQSAAR